MLYELFPILDILEYGGFAWENRRDSIRGQRSRTMDFDPESVGPWPRRVPVKLASVWPATKVIGNVREWNDFPSIQLDIPAFSGRAVEALEDLLLPNGELLPVDSSVGQYFAYNTLTVSDVLDLEHSQVTWGLDRAYASRIIRFECFADRIEGQAIFRLPQQMLNFFVTETFAQRVRDHKLQGFDLAKVWPLAPGEDWWQMQMQRRKRWQKEAAHFRRKHGINSSTPPLEPWRDI